MSEADVKALTTARQRNDRKATCLVWALRLETVAILAMTSAVILVLFVRR